MIYPNSGVRTDVLELIKQQMITDFNNMKEGKPVTLLFKWLPSINTTNKEKRELAKQIVQYLHISHKRYRVALSKMRAYLEVVEKQMTDGKWGEIKYESVPSKANVLYRKAFLRHDEERRTKYLESLKKGETKINASKLFPYEVYYKANGRDETIEQLWKNLPEIKNDTGSVLCVADGSGSMSWEHLGGTKATALDVANSLAIYFAERAQGEFKNTYITFSSYPTLVHLGDNNTLAEKKEIAERHCECSDTNIEKTFNLILDTAVNNNMRQEDIPTTILILSDMEFNSAVEGNPTKSLFANISNKFKDTGYKMPRLVFWNIMGRTSTIPVTKNELGVALVSGFTTTIFDMVLNNKLDPLEILLDKLNTPRYLRIKEIVEK